MNTLHYRCLRLLLRFGLLRLTYRDRLLLILNGNDICPPRRRWYATASRTIPPMRGAIPMMALLLSAQENGVTNTIRNNPANMARKAIMVLRSIGRLRPSSRTSMIIPQNGVSEGLACCRILGRGGTNG